MKRLLFEIYTKLCEIVYELKDIKRMLEDRNGTIS